MTDNIGIYIHIPFCEKKCSYCDFYSSFKSEALTEEYLSALSREIKRWGGLTDRPVDTVYIGGGTPSILGSKIEDVLCDIKAAFNVSENAEITAEANPETSEEFLISALKGGANRISFGMQSANEDELKMLGRGHTAIRVKEIVNKSKQIGFKNISVDLMLGLPFSDKRKLKNSLDFIKNLDVSHVSAYILSVEPNTRLAKENIKPPSQDGISEQYLYVCDYLENSGYEHYEISNFAKRGFESRHNLRYWRLSDYIGIGPSAHSCFEGKRFYYERDIKKFIRNPETVFEGVSDVKQEKLMLNLRLSSGIDLSEFFGEEGAAFAFAKKLEAEGYAVINGSNISLTDRGMLISNSIICEFSEMLK